MAPECEGGLTRRRLLALAPLALSGAALLRAATARAQDFRQVPLPPEAARADPLHAFWDTVPREFPQREGLLHFNTSGLGVPPFEVLSRMQEVALESAMHGDPLRSAYLETTRTTLARFLGAEPDEIALMRNATEAMNVVARGLDLQRGDEILMTTHEHPGGAAPWLALAQERGLKLRFHEPRFDPVLDATTFWDHAGGRTRGIVVSHVLFTVGAIMPVAELAAEAHRRGMWCAVDGAQAFGILPVDVRQLGADFYVASGHKWLLGPVETGFLYVRRDRLARLRPTFVGSHTTDAGGYDLVELRLEPSGSARRFEYGTRSPVQAAGLAAAIEWLEAMGPDVVRARAVALARRFAARAGAHAGVEILTPASALHSVPIVTFRISRRPYPQVVEWFQTQMGIRVRPIGERGLDAVRASFHLVNRTVDVDWFAEGVRVLGA